jgi:outer membrane protein assembly factor BamD (BamD/ComL family)
MRHRYYLTIVVMITLLTQLPAVAQEPVPKAEPSPAETELTNLCKLIKEQPGSVSDQQVVEAIVSASKLNRPFLAEQALRVYLASQSNPSQAVRLQAIDSARRVGDFNAAMVRCKRYLDSAKPGAEASRVAATLYWIQIDILNLLDDAYRTMGSEMDKFCTGPSARKLDAWYLKQAAGRRDYANLARRLTAIHSSSMPAEQTKYFYSSYVDLLLSATVLPTDENKNAAADLAQLGRVIKDDERTKQRCALYAANLKFAATAEDQKPEDRSKQFAPVIAVAKNYVAKVRNAQGLFDVMWVLGGSDSRQFGTYFSEAHQGLEKRAFFVQEFGKLPVAQQQLFFNKGSYHSFASQQQWTELTAKYPQAFQRNLGITLKYVTAADCKRLVAGVQKSTEQHALIIRSLANGRDFSGCIDQLVVQDAWHQGGYDNFYQLIRNQLRSSYQAAQTAEKKEFPPQWYEKAIVKYGTQRVAKTPLALGVGTVSEYVQYAWSIEPQNIEKTLDSLAWVPYTEAERKSAFDPAFGVFVSWADGARKRRQSGLDTVASANKKVDEATAKLAKLKADQADKNQIAQSELLLKNEKDLLAKANEQLKAADADVARISPVEAAFKKVMQAKAGDPNRAPDAYCKHLTSLIIARQRKDARAFAAAGRQLYPLLKNYRTRKLPMAKAAWAAMLRSPQDMDVLDFELEVLADQLKTFDSTSAASLADMKEVTDHIMASHMSWSFTRIPMADRKKALKLHDVFADAMSVQIDRGRFPKWLFESLRGTRYGTGWGNEPENLKRSEELVDKMIQRDVLAKSDFRYGAYFGTTTYMWLIRNEVKSLAEKYPVETFFDAKFIAEAKRAGYIDETYFLQGGLDKEFKIRELAAVLTSNIPTVPVDARRSQSYTLSQFIQMQGRGLGNSAESRDSMLTKVESYYGKTRFDDVAMGRTRIALIGDMSKPEIRQDYFAKVSAYLDRAGKSAVRSPAPNLYNLRTIHREQPLTDQEFATIARLYAPESGLSGAVGSGANEMMKRLLPEMITPERQGELFTLAPYLWKIAAYDTNFQKQFIDQIVAFQKAGQFDLAASLSSVGLEMFEGQVRDSDKNRLRVARAQSMLNVGGMAEIDVKDPRYSILLAQSDFLTGNLQRAWQNYNKNTKLAITVVQQLDPSFVSWLIRRNTSLTDFDAAEELAREALQKMETHPEQFSQGSRARLLLAYANIAFERPEYPRARALYGRIAAAQEFAGTRSQTLAQLQVAEVDRVTKHYGEAIDRLDKMLKSKDRFAQREGHFYMAKVLFDQEQFTDALKEIEMVFNYDTTHAAARIFEGRVNLRIKRLEQASRINVGFLTDQQFIVPGEPLRIGLRDQALAIAGDTRAIEMRAWTDAGDEEHFSLVPFADSKTQFEGQVATKLGASEKDDHVLQLLGSDKVYYDFSEQFKKSHNIEGTVSHFLVVLSDSQLFSSSGKILSQQQLEQQAMERAIRSQLKIAAKKKKEIPLGELRAHNQVKPGNPISVRVVDPDQSVTDDADKLSVTLSTTSGDKVTFELNETGGHTGVFDGAVPTATALATAVASDSEQASQPVFVISAGDHPAWVGQPDNQRPKTFAVDLNASERLGKMKIDANVPGRRLKQFLVQTSVDGKKFETIGSWPSANSAWDGAVRLETFASLDAMKMTVAMMQEALAIAPPEEVTISRPESFDKVLTSKASAEIRHIVAAFHFPTRQIANFQLQPKTENGVAEYTMLIDGKPAQALEQAEGDETEAALQFKSVLGQGVHRIDIYVAADKNCQSSFQLLRNIDEPPYVEPCPMTMFDPEENEIIAKLFADKATTVTADENGGSFEIEFGPAVRARVVRLLLADFETDAPAIQKIHLTAQDERQILPTKVDLLALKTNQILEIVPGDKVSVVYRDPRSIIPRNKVRESFLSATYANGTIEAALLTGYDMDGEGMRQPKYIGLRRFKPDDTIMVVVNDSDADSTAKLDTVTFAMRTADGEPVELQALETSEHSGVFLGKIFVVEGEPQRKSEIQVAPGEDLVLTYVDQENTDPGIPWDRSATIESVVYVEPEFRLFNTESTPLSETEIAQARTQSSSMDFVPASRTLAAVRPGEIDIKEVPNAVMGAPFICELVWPTIAQTTASTAEIFVQTSSGRQRFGQGVEGKFDVRVPGTIRIVTGPSNGGGGATPPGYRGMVVVGDPNALNPMDDGRFTFSVPMRLAAAPTTSFATPEVLENTTSQTQFTKEDLSSLVVKGTDEIFVGFKYTDDEGESHWITRKFSLSSDAFFHIMNRTYGELEGGVYVGQSAYFRVIDMAKDTSDQRDRVTINATDASGENRAIELIETFAHSGVFKGPVKFLYADEKAGDIPAGSVGVTYGQQVEAIYQPLGETEPLLDSLEIFKGADGDLQPFTKRFEDPLTAVRTRLTIAEAYFELAKKHRKLGQDELTEREIATGKRLLEEALRDYPDTEARAQVDYLLANLSLEFAEEADDEEMKKKYFREALGRFSSIVSNYRDSAYAPKAQFKKALTLEQMGEIERASEEYVKLSYRWPDSPLIAETIARLGQYFFSNGIKKKKLAETQKTEGDEKVALAEQEEDDTKAAEMRDESTEILISAEKAKVESTEDFVTAGKVFGRLAVRFPSHRLADKTTALSGQCFMRAEQYDDAVVAFKKVYSNEKADKEIRAESFYWAGESHMRKVQAGSGNKQDDLKQAYLLFKNLTLYFPESKWSRYARGRLADEDLVTFDTPVEEEP